MNIEQLKILDVLGKPKRRFAIPVFQRVYSWNTRQCEELLNDIVHAGQTGNAHFMGLLLCSHDPDDWHGIEQLDVIDGQQRLTTLTLLLVAFRGYLERGGSCPGVTSADIEEHYLAVSASDAQSAKLVLSQMDRETLAALAGTTDPPDEPAQRLIDNCLLFAEHMDASDFDAERFWKGLNLLQTALVMLGPADSPQVVFENLNAKGMPLSTADRVRNYLVATTEGADQEHLYADCWLPLEHVASTAQPQASVSDILHAWLAQSYRSVHLSDASEAYDVFKTCLRDRYDASLEQLLADVATFAARYVNDADFREETQLNADGWIAGKPKDSISELKLFGD